MIINSLLVVSIILMFLMSVFAFLRAFQAADRTDQLINYGTAVLLMFFAMLSICMAMGVGA